MKDDNKLLYVYVCIRIICMYLCTQMCLPTRLEAHSHEYEFQDIISMLSDSNLNSIILFFVELQQAIETFG